MHFDIFFSLSQTPVRGNRPDEAAIFEHFFAQVEAGDALGFGTAWIAEAHLSTEVQKRHRCPVIPHWEGEVGLNCDFLQLAARIFARTSRIEAGSAVMNILCNGGPVAHAERVAMYLALHGLDPAESRRIHLGFAAGRFDFHNTPSGPSPRNAFEEEFWRPVKGKLFEAAAEIFVRLLRGDVLASEEVAVGGLRREDFATGEQWSHALDMSGAVGESIDVAPWWKFEEVKIVPQDFRRELVQLIVGSHDPRVHQRLNRFLPVQVFNLSITPPPVIEATHQRMADHYHPQGGPWRREYMPRTVFVFLNHEPGLGPLQRSVAAQAEAREALGSYWKALEGTLDPAKVENAADNALIGNAEEVAGQIVDRFHPEDRLMLWFDFFNHDCPRVLRNMQAFVDEVIPRVEEARG